MAVEFEPLVFEIKQGSNDASKGVDELIQSLSKLKSVTGNLSVLSKTTAQLKKLNAELNQFQNIDKLAKLAGALASLSKISNIKVPTGFYKNLAGIAGATTILTEEGVSRFERLATALKEVGRVGNIRIPNTKVPTSNTTTVLPTTPKDSGVAHSAGMTEAQNRINAARSAIASARQQVEQMRASTAEAVRQSEAFANALRGIIQAAEIAASVIHWFIAAVKVIINVLKKVASVIKTVITQAKRLAVAVGKVLLRPFISLAEQIKKSIAGVKQFFDFIARIAMYRLIRGAIAALTQGLQEGMENLYQYSKLVGTDFADAMDRMATNALYVKNSLAAMVSPIIEALAPAVDFLTDKFVELLNTVNMFIARLLGKETYTVAKRVAAVWQEVGDNTEDATKKLKSYTIGIDELNIIEETGNERDSSWSPDIDYRKWFEELPTESNWITEFADKLKEAFENGDWKTLGTLLGDKINDLIDSIDWEEIGSTIGYYLDGAIKTAYFFLKEIDFQKAGASVADLINNLLEAVDWEYLGRLLVVKITSMWDFAIGFLKELDWGEVGHSIFTFIIGALNEFSEWLNEIDWVDLGETLLKKIQDFFEEFDFKEVIKTVSRVLGETVRSMKDLLTPLWESLKEWWKEHIQGKNFLDTIKNLGDYLLKFVDEYILTPFLTALVGEEGMGGKSGLGKLKEIGENILLGILKGINEWINSHLLEWVIKNIFGEYVWALCKAFGIASPAKEMIPYGEFIMLGILEGMINIIKNLASWVSKYIFKPFSDIFNAVFLGGDFEIPIRLKHEKINRTWEDEKQEWVIEREVFQTELWEGFSENGQSEFFTNIGKNIMEFFRSGLVSVFEKILKDLKDFADDCAKTLEVIKQKIIEVIDLLKQYAKDWIAKLKIYDFATGVIQGVKLLLESLKDKVVTVTATLIDLVTGALGVPVGALESLAGKVYTVTVAAVDTASQVVAGARSALDSFEGRVVTASVAAVDNTNSAVNSAKSALQSVATGAYNATINAINNVAGAVSQAKSALQGVATGAYSAVINARNNVAGAVSQAKSALQGVATGAYNAVVTATDKASSIAENVKSALNSIPTSIAVGITVTVAIGGAVAALSGLGGLAGLAFAEGGIFTQPVFFHAQGGIVDKPIMFHAGGGLHVAGEAGREAILPLQNHTEWMDILANKTKDAIGEEEEPEGSVFYDALSKFFGNYLQPVMSNMDANMQRQADKDERPVVRIGQRDIKDAYDRQSKADGYRFTR